MNTEEDLSWGRYSVLVLKELERLNENYETMKKDMDTRFTELNSKLSEVKTIESKVVNHQRYIEKVNDIWSPSQMQVAKDEIYKQKNKWTAAIAIISFVQILMGIGIALIVKFFK